MKPRGITLVRLMALQAILFASSSAIAEGCFDSAIVSPSPFMGNNGEIFRLLDGSVWEVQYEYEYLYEYSPAVVVCPDRGKLMVAGKSLNIRSVGAARKSGKRKEGRADTEWQLVEETELVGNISGTVEAGRIFRTTSGSVYEVIGITLQLVLELQPSVTVLRNGDLYKLVVEGFDEPLLCAKLK